jgi:hypothetical protein
MIRSPTFLPPPQPTHSAYLLLQIRYGICNGALGSHFGQQYRSYNDRYLSSAINF